MRTKTLVRVRELKPRTIAVDASVATGSMVFPYEVLPFACTDRKRVARRRVPEMQTIVDEQRDALRDATGSEQQRKGLYTSSNRSHEQITHSRA